MMTDSDRPSQDEPGYARPPELQLSTALTLEQIQSLSDSIAVYDQYVEHLVETQYPKAKLLQQIPGVGPLTSLAFILTIDDPARFPKSRQVGATAEPRRSIRETIPTRDHQSGDDFSAVYWSTPPIMSSVVLGRTQIYADGARHRGPRWAAGEEARRRCGS
jgi:hypothetical protein